MWASAVRIHRRVMKAQYARQIPQKLHFTALQWLGYCLVIYCDRKGKLLTQRIIKGYLHLQLMYAGFAEKMSAQCRDVEHPLQQK